MVIKDPETGENVEFYGFGGGFTAGGTQKRTETIFREWSGGGGGSFSSDEEAKFGHEYSEYGKCIIELLCEK